VSDSPLHSVLHHGQGLDQALQRRHEHPRRHLLAARQALDIDLDIIGLIFRAIRNLFSVSQSSIKLFARSRFRPQRALPRLQRKFIWYPKSGPDKSCQRKTDPEVFQRISRILEPLSSSSCPPSPGHTDSPSLPPPRFSARWLFGLARSIARGARLGRGPRRVAVAPVAVGRIARKPAAAKPTRAGAIRQPGNRGPKQLPSRTIRFPPSPQTGLI
jgi:hypothetical protein